MRSSAGWGAVLLLVGCACGRDAPEPDPAPPGCALDGESVRVERAFPELTFEQPLGFLQAPGEAGRAYVLEKRGLVRSFAFDPGVTASEVFVDLRERVNDSAAESGLLGMAFHPGWAQNREVLVSYTAHGGPVDLTSTLSRFRSTDGGATLAAGSEEVLLTLEQPYSNHNGGHVLFGPDGLVYFGFGDGGSAGDPQNRAQDLNTLFGKLLRLDVAGGTPYAIPADNPFVGQAARGEVFAYGLRNPWRFSFDRETGELWLGDVGQDDREEIDRVIAGGNYGWPLKEGFRCFRPASDCDRPGLIDPVLDYPRSDGGSITGGFVYRGTAIPALRGHYVYGDFLSGRIWALVETAGTFEPVLLANTDLSISSFAEDLDGELYVVDLSGGGLHRLVAGPSGGECDAQGAAAASR